MMNPSIVCIKQSASNSEQHEYECLDLVMALASFDYRVHLVFYGEGVSALLNLGQDSRPAVEDDQSWRKTYHKRLQALPLFEVNDIWVDEMSLNARQLQISQLASNIKLLPPAQFKALLHNSLAVYTL